MVTKKGWLDYLYYNVGQQQFDFRLNSLSRQPDGSCKSSKWKKYSELIFPIDYNEDWKIKNINNREILPNEVVIDLEEKESLQKVLEKIKSFKVPYYVWDTHSRGFHIHIFLDRILSVEEKLWVIKECGGDIQKANNGTTIALENAEHWKSGKKTELLLNGN